MSTGTNKERLEQNNTLLEDIKTQIQNLPEAGGSGGVKLFETEEQMQADTTAKEGDLAVVCRKDGSTFEGLYKYSNSSWSLAPTQLTAIANYVYDKVFYGQNGVETGTLGTPDNSFADTNAELVYKIQNTYNDMEPRVLTHDDKTIDKNIYFIPVKKDGTPLLNTSNVTNMSGMFENCTNLTTIPLLNTSNVIYMISMFSNCTNLAEIPLLDTSKVTDMSDMFNYCTNLTTIPLFNTSNVRDMSGMFENCTNLTTIPLLNTSNVILMLNMFGGCTNLTTIPLLNTSSVTNIAFMFENCTSLSDESLNNILAMCKNATSYSNTKTLAYIGLTSEQATKCTTLSNYQAFLDAGWTTGY